MKQKWIYGILACFSTECWHGTTLQRSCELVAVSPGSHTVPHHTGDRWTTVQISATPLARCHHPHPEASRSQDRNINPWRKGLTKAGVSRSPHTSWDKETPARPHPVRSSLYGSLTLKCPNFSPPPSSPTVYCTVGERKRVSSSMNPEIHLQN